MIKLLLFLVLHEVTSQDSTAATTSLPTTTTTTTTTTIPSTTLAPNACDDFTNQICSFSSPSSILAQIEHTSDESSCQQECQMLDACTHFSWITYTDATP